jgi:hypothetical protein
MAYVKTLSKKTFVQKCMTRIFYIFTASKKASSFRTHCCDPIGRIIAGKLHLHHLEEEKK